MKVLGSILKRLFSLLLLAFCAIYILLPFFNYSLLYGYGYYDNEDGEIKPYDDPYDFQMENYEIYLNDLKERITHGDFSTDTLFMIMIAVSIVLAAIVGLFGLVGVFNRRGGPKSVVAVPALLIFIIDLVIFIVKTSGTDLNMGRIVIELFFAWSIFILAVALLAMRWRRKPKGKEGGRHRRSR